MFNSFFGEINRFRRLGGCARCLELNHFGSNCSCPQDMLCALRGVTNLNSVKLETSQGCFGGPRCVRTSPAQYLKRWVQNIKRWGPTVFLPQIRELQKTPTSAQRLPPWKLRPSSAIPLPRKLHWRRRWRTSLLIPLHLFQRVWRLKIRRAPLAAGLSSMVIGRVAMTSTPSSLLLLLPRWINFMRPWK
jgi:hypothetical protein